MPTVLKGAGWRSKPRSSANLNNHTKAVNAKLPDAGATDYVTGAAPRERTRLETQTESGKIAEKPKKIENAQAENGKVAEKPKEGEDAPKENGKKAERTKETEEDDDNDENARKRKEEEEGASDDSPTDAQNKSENAAAPKEDDKAAEKAPSLPRNAPSSGKGVGYCKKVGGKAGKSSFPRVPRYGVYSNLLPESYTMPWKQDMKNRSAILANVRIAGKDRLPNIEHNDFLFLKHREQLSPNVEDKQIVEKKVAMPSIDEILNPGFHHHTIKTKATQRKAIYPAAPSLHFFHPRLRHVTECYSCVPDFDE